MESVEGRVIVALDVQTSEQALRVIDGLMPFTGIFKVGLELFHAEGPQAVHALKAAGARVFLDTKLHDIPNTVAGAAAVIGTLGIQMFNVHCSGGLSMMRGAVAASTESSARVALDPPLVLGVTVLTSISSGQLSNELGVDRSLEEQVVALARLSELAGLSGVIASPLEIEPIRRTVSSRMKIITPGVRPLWYPAQDQQRVLTPGEAIALGADYIVVGRPITRPPSEVGSSRDAMRRIVDELHQVLG